MPNIDDNITNPVGFVDPSTLSGGGGGGLFSGLGGAGPLSSPSAFSSLTGGISSIFSGIGEGAEAKDYQKAADIALQNEQLAKESGRIQQTQLQRKVFSVTGQQAAAAGGGNLASGGSMGDILHSSLIQGGLQHALIGLQTGIEANSFQQQATAYQGQAAAAKAAGTGGILSGILGIGASIFGL